MALRIERRPRAAKDAEETADYIARDSLAASLRFLGSLESTLADIAMSPQAGSHFESFHPDLMGIRFRRVRKFPNYLIFYRVTTDSIEVIRILHGSRELGQQLNHRP